MSTPEARIVNVSRWERLARTTVGTLFVAVGVFILADGAPLYGRVGALLLLNTGLNLAVTGAGGYCPLNAQLDRSLFAAIVHPRWRHSPNLGQSTSGG